MRPMTTTSQGKRRRQADELHLTDTRLAGFLKARDVAYIGHLREGRTVWFRFPLQAAEALLAEYVDSPEARYDAACKTLYRLATTRTSHIAGG